MYCKNCGKENADEAKFCVNCGAKLIKEDLFSYSNETENLKKELEKEINKELSKEEQKELEKKEKLEKEIALVEAIPFNKNDDIATLKLPKYGKPYESLHKGMPVTRYPRLNHYVDMLKNDFFRVKTFAVISLMVLLVVFFIFIILMTNEQTEHQNEQYTSQYFWLLYVAIGLFVLTGILFVIAGINDKDIIDAPMALKSGRNSKAKLMARYQKGKKYYIIFRYINREEVYQTTQRVSEETYNKLEHELGNLIDVKIGLIGVYEDALKKHYKTYKAKKGFTFTGRI